MLYKFKTWQRKEDGWEIQRNERGSCWWHAPWILPSYGYNRMIAAWAKICRASWAPTLSNQCRCTPYMYI